jgi:2-polyprenyl-6-methoxyphenol hydroxylase-like FAD-dependent oxidoreductase
MGSTSWFIQSGVVDFSTTSASFRQRAKPLNHGRQSAIAMSSPRLSTVGIHASGSLKKVETCFWWGLYDRRPLASWTMGRLALLGDAAHAMLPHLGQGANQAIEDGVALAVFLEERDPAEIADALRQYEAFRRARTDVIQAEARKQGLRLDSRSGSLQDRDREITRSAEFRKWLYDYDIERAAIAYLNKGST